MYVLRRCFILSTDSLLDGVAGAPLFIIIIPPPTGPPCAGFMPVMFIEFIIAHGRCCKQWEGIGCSDEEVRGLARSAYWSMAKVCGRDSRGFAAEFATNDGKKIFWLRFLQIRQDMFILDGFVRWSSTMPQR